MVTVLKSPPPGANTAPAPLPSPSGRAPRPRLGRGALPLLFFAPAVLFVLAVDFYPALYGISESLFQTRYVERVGFAGLDNYLQLLRDPTALGAAQVSLAFTFGTLVVSIPVGLGLALLLNRPWPLRTAFRTILLIPWVVSQTVAALLWGWLLNPLYGPVSFQLAQWGLPSLDLLGNPATALPAVIFVNAWRSFPFAMVLLLAALQTISEDLVEAARVDGASGWQVFAYVTLPSIRTTLLTVTIMLSLYAFNMVTLIYTLTGGGPLARTQSLSLTAFKEAFTNWHLGYAATFGVLIFALNLLFSTAYVRVLKSNTE